MSKRGQPEGDERSGRYAGDKQPVPGRLYTFSGWALTTVAGKRGLGAGGGWRKKLLRGFKNRPHSDRSRDGGVWLFEYRFRAIWDAGGGQSTAGTDLFGGICKAGSHGGKILGAEYPLKL